MILFKIDKFFVDVECKWIVISFPCSLCSKGRLDSLQTLHTKKVFLTCYYGGSVWVFLKEMAKWSTFPIGKDIFESFFEGGNKANAMSQ